MARARVVGPRDTTASGDGLQETYKVFFYGADLAAPDSTDVTLAIGANDSIATVEDNLVTAVVNAATALGYSVLRTRVGFPKTARGS